MIISVPCFSSQFLSFSLEQMVKELIKFCFPHLIWLNCIINRQGHIWPIMQLMNTLFSTWGHGRIFIKTQIFKELMMTCWCQHVHNKEILDQYKNWEVNDLHFEEWCHNILWLVTKWKPIRRGRLSAVQSVKRRAQEPRAGIQWRESARNLPSPRAKKFSPTDECVQAILSQELNLEE